MEYLASKLACFLVLTRQEDQEHYEIYKFGFQTGLESISCIVVSLIISIWLNMFWEFLLFISIFVLLRSYVGGLHLASFWSCFLCSSVVQIGILRIAQRLVFSMSFAWIVIAACMIIILFIAPVQCENRILEKQEMKFVYGRVVIILSIVLIIGMLVTIFRLNSILTLICDTLTMVVVSALLGKVKYLYFIGQSVSKV